MAGLKTYQHPSTLPRLIGHYVIKPPHFLFHWPNNRKVNQLINCIGLSQGREPTSQNCSEENSVLPFSSATTQTRNKAGKCPNCYPHPALVLFLCAHVTLEREIILPPPITTTHHHYHRNLRHKTMRILICVAGRAIPLFSPFEIFATSLPAYTRFPEDGSSVA